MSGGGGDGDVEAGVSDDGGSGELDFGMDEDVDGGGIIVEPPEDGAVVEPPDGGIIVQPPDLASADSGVTPPSEDPQDCIQAAASRSYIGCDYWPTVTANAVWKIFDFAVVVSNPGTVAAMVTVTGNGTNQLVTVMPGALTKIFLPWVTELKGPDAASNGDAPPPITKSIRKNGGAYHLVSSLPVLVYQFNALEYRGQGGPPGKSWSSCPGNGGIGCYSFSNDASLLLPSTAMTGKYRVATCRGIDLIGPYYSGFVSITATADNTTVNVKTPTTSNILSGTNVAAVAANSTGSYSLNAGDVLQLTGKAGKSGDLSGMQIDATQPVQVIGGVPCFNNPSGSCDHIEESVMPAETLGKRYAVTMPTGPQGTRVTATVRFVGNEDGTTLQYSTSLTGVPSTLQAGQVVEVATVNKDFIVVADKEFIVSTVQKSSAYVDTNQIQGDPSLSHAVAIEQYRKKYVFLAPQDYVSNYADIVAPTGAVMTLDGAQVTATRTSLGATTGYDVLRITLGAGMAGAHTIVSDKPIGLQVIGYGSYTSYQYPGGLNLAIIARVPF